MKESIVIVAAKRTPIGSFLGTLSPLTAPQLGSLVIKDLLKTSQLSPDQVGEVIMGQVLTAGVGQAPARQAAIYAGLNTSVPCTTVNKVCGSGLKAVMLAADQIQLNPELVVIAGGQECMSTAPHILMGSRQGYRMGHQSLEDSMIKDGLWDPYNHFHMGNAAELCVKKYNFTREQQDAFAKASYERALHAQKIGHFQDELTPVRFEAGRVTVELTEDEEPKKAKFDKIPTLKPAFDKAGTITAANASKINDGAAAILLMSESKAKSIGLKPLAKVISYASHAQAPEWFTTAPVEAMKKALKQAHLSPADIDLWEINEAFANVTMAATHELEIDASKVNIHGGAVALGHPIGASGSRILATLCHALRSHSKKRGCASLCIGGGEGVAMVVESY